MGKIFYHYNDHANIKFCNENNERTIFYKLLYPIAESSRRRCPTLSAPTNGRISCSLGNDDTPNHNKIFGFTCDDGFDLIGSSSRTCLVSGRRNRGRGSWN